MYCKNCGNQINETDNFCLNCGTRNEAKNSDTYQHAPNYQAYNQSYNQTTTQQTNVCGLLGFIFSFIYPLAGLILSIIGLVKAKSYNNNYKGLALAGVIISAAYLLINLIVVFYYFFILLLFSPLFW